MDSEHAQAQSENKKNVILNDAAVEKIGVVIAGMTATEAAGKWAAKSMDEVFIHLLYDRAERRMS